MILRLQKWFFLPLIGTLLFHASVQAQCDEQFYITRTAPVGPLCAPGNVTLRAQFEGGLNYVELRWWESQTSTSPLKVSVARSGEALSSDYSFDAVNGSVIWVSLYNGDTRCETARKSYTVTVGGEWAVVQTEYARECEGKAKIQAKGSPAGGTYQFYFYNQGGGGYQFITSNATGYIEIANFNPSNAENYAVRYEVNGYCSSANYKTIEIDLSNTTPPVISGNLSICQGTSTVLTASGTFYNTYRWYDKDGNQIHQGPTYLVPATLPVGDHQFFARGVREDGCLTFARSVTVTIKAKPTDGTITANTTSICLGESVTITSSGGVGIPHYWCSSNGGQSWNVFEAQYAGKNSFEHTPSRPGTYRYHLRNKGDCGFCWDAGNCPTNPYVDVVVTGKPFQEQNQNFIIATDVWKEGIKTSGQVCDLTVGQAQWNIAYFDGLGRPMQNVMVQGSPSQIDIIQPIIYDNLGREPLKYLPYTDGNNGFYKDDAILSSSAGKVFDFYNTPGADPRIRTTKPFAQSHFETSPLNRVLELGAPGEDWQIGTPGAATNHTTGIIRRTNRGNEVSLFTYTFASDPAKYGSVSSTAYYPAGQLLVTEIRDEHHALTVEYKDKAGRMVVKKVQFQGGGTPNPVADFLSTYYIYDDFGYLRMVIQPEGAATISATSSFTADADFIKKWCFTYHYDAKGRVIEKQVPGAGTIYMIYGKRDELLLSCNPQQRLSADYWFWNFTKYDALGRVVLSGIYKYVFEDGQEKSLKTVQKAADDFIAPLPGMNYEKRDASASTYHATFLYTLGLTFPALDASRDEILTANYYDDYSFGTNIGYEGASLALTGKPTGTKVRTLAASSDLDYKANNNPFLLTVSFYDQYGRVIRTEADNHLSGKDITTLTYDFAGKLLAKKTDHTGKEAVITQEEYLYDHAGRLLTHYHRIQKGAISGPRTILKQLAYNELGQVIEKKLHGTTPNTPVSDESIPPGLWLGKPYTQPTEHEIKSPNSKTVTAREEITLTEGFWAEQNSTFTASLTGSYSQPTPATASFLQSIAYKYNVRGWLTHINDAALSDATDLFGMELQYNTTDAQDFHGSAIAAGVKQYNGNIAAQKWKTRTDNAPVGRMYVYRYDQVNRLSGADYSASNYQANSDFNEDFSLPAITYSGNGNIGSLKQSGLYQYQKANGNQLKAQFATVDDLTYTYEGNRLLQVEEINTGTEANPSTNRTATGLAGDFQNKASKAGEFSYDDVNNTYGNGNIVRDENKGIGSIVYNHLNLPETISFGTNGKIVYTYNAAGVKLRKEVYQGASSAPDRTDYVGGMVYTQNKLQFLGTEEGRAIHPYFAQEGTNTYVYEYHYKDHLGNLRLAFREPKRKVSYTATMEAIDSYKEEVQFSNVVKSRNTDRWKTGSASALLNSSNVLGPWKTIKVRKGDQIKAEVFAFYQTPASGKNMGLTAYVDNANNFKQDGETRKKVSLLQVGISINPVPDRINDEPKAYLQMIYYDKDYKYIDTKTRWVTAEAKSASWQNLIIRSPEINEATNSDLLDIAQDGYVQILVANESNVDVWFDDLKITYQEALTVQENHYSPWGLNLTGIEKQGNPDHKFQYNGKEKQEELGLNWIDYGARMYDAQLGRWHAIDAYSDSYTQFSPYNYTLNNPANLIDPNGNWVEESTKRYDKNGRELSWLTFRKVARVEKTITVHNAKILNASGEEFSPEAVARAGQLIREDIQNTWTAKESNRNGTTEVSVSVQFDGDPEVVTSLDQVNMEGKKQDNLFLISSTEAISKEFGGDYAGYQVGNMIVLNPGNAGLKASQVETDIQSDIKSGREPRGNPNYRAELNPYGTGADPSHEFGHQGGLFHPNGGVMSINHDRTYTPTYKNLRGLFRRGTSNGGIYSDRANSLVKRTRR